MLSVRGLTYAYPGAARPILRDLDFDVGAGEIFGCLGPEGTGKTTLLKILVGLIRDYTGTVAFRGRELGEWSRDFYAHIGVALESPGHFPAWTARENLGYFGALYAGGTEPVPGLLEKVGLAENARERVGRFSGEMKKRLGFARAILHRPEALFLDEPTAGLPAAHAERILGLIRAHRRSGGSVILATSDPGLAEALCDRVARMEGGGVTVISPPKDLRPGNGDALSRESL